MTMHTLTILTKQKLSMSNEHVLYSINIMALYIILNLRNKKIRHLKIFNCKLLLIKKYEDNKL